MLSFSLAIFILFLSWNRETALTLTVLSQISAKPVVKNDFNKSASIIIAFPELAKDS